MATEYYKLSEFLTDWNNTKLAGPAQHQSWIASLREDQRELAAKLQSKSLDDLVEEYNIPAYITLYKLHPTYQYRMENPDASQMDLMMEGIPLEMEIIGGNRGLQGVPTDWADKILFEYEFLKQNGNAASYEEAWAWARENADPVTYEEFAAVRPLMDFDSNGLAFNSVADAHNDRFRDAQENPPPIPYDDGTAMSVMGVYIGNTQELRNLAASFDDGSDNQRTLLEMAEKYEAMGPLGLAINQFGYSPEVIADYIDKDGAVPPTADQLSAVFSDPDTDLSKYGSGDVTAADAQANFTKELGDATEFGLSTNLFDLDGNGKLDALSDGVMMLRYLFGLRGKMLTDGAAARDATRTDEEIEEYLNQVADVSSDLGGFLDIDGNGKADALTDGVLLLRYGFGLRNNTDDRMLTSGATANVKYRNVDLSEEQVAEKIEDMLTLVPKKDADGNYYVVDKAGERVTYADYETSLQEEFPEQGQGPVDPVDPVDPVTPYEYDPSTNLFSIITDDGRDPTSAEMEDRLRWFDDNPPESEEIGDTRTAEVQRMLDDYGSIFNAILDNVDVGDRDKDGTHNYLDAFADDDRFTTVEDKEQYDIEMARVAEEKRKEEARQQEIRDAQTARNQTLGFDSEGQRNPKSIFVNADANTVHYQGFSVPLTPQQILDGVKSVYETGRFTDPRYARLDKDITDAATEIYLYEDAPKERFQAGGFFNSSISGQDAIDQFLAKYTSGTALEGHAGGVATGSTYKVPITFSTVEGSEFSDDDYITLGGIIDTWLPENEQGERPNEPLPSALVGDPIKGVDKVPTVDEMGRYYFSFLDEFGPEVTRWQFSNLPEQYANIWAQVKDDIKVNVKASNIQREFAKEFNISDIRDVDGIENIDSTRIKAWAESLPNETDAQKLFRDESLKIAEAVKKHQEDPASLTYKESAYLNVFRNAEEGFFELPEQDEDLFGEGTAIGELQDLFGYQEIQRLWKERDTEYAIYTSNELWDKTKSNWRHGQERLAAVSSDNFVNGMRVFPDGTPVNAEFNMPRISWQLDKQFDEWQRDLAEFNMPLFLEQDEATQGFIDTVFEDFPLWYDNTRLYMKDPYSGGDPFQTLDSNYQVQGYQWITSRDGDLYYEGEMPDYSEFANPGKRNEGEGFLIDISGGDAPVGSYTMVWVAQPRYVGKAEQVLDDPVLNIIAAFIPGGQLVLTGLKILNEQLGDGRSVKGMDYASAIISYLKLSGKLNIPASEAEAAEIADAAEKAALAGGASAAEAAIAGAQASAAALANIGLGSLSAQQSIALINAVGSGDNIGSALFSAFGADYISSAFDYFNVPFTEFPSNVQSAITQVATDVLDGDSFEDALNKELASQVGDYAGDIVGEFFEENGIGDKVGEFFSELTGDLEDAVSVAGNIFDDEVLQPLIEGVRNVLPEGGIESLTSLSNTLQESFNSLENVIREAATNIDDTVIDPITDAIRGSTSKFVGVSTAFPEGLPQDAVEEAEAMINGVVTSMGITLDELGDDATNILKESVGTLIVTGELTDENKARILTRELVTAERVEAAFGPDSRIINGITPEVFTAALRNALNASMLGGDSSYAFQTTIAKSIETRLQNAISGGLRGLVQDATEFFENTSETYRDARQAEEDRDEIPGKIEDELEKIDGINTRQTTRAGEIAALQEVATADGASDVDKKAYYDAVAENNRLLSLEELELQGIQTNITDLENEFVRLDTVFDNKVADLSTITVDRDAALEPFYGDVKESVIKDFNSEWKGAAEYAQANGISEDEALDHYISQGLMDGVPVNMDQYNAVLYGQISDQTDDALRMSGIDTSKMTDGQRGAVINQVFTTIQEQNLEELGLTDLQFLTQALDPESDLTINLDPTTIVSTALSPPDAPLLTIPEINYTLVTQDYTNIVSNVLSEVEDDPEARKLMLDALSTNALRLVTLPDGSKKWVQPTTLVQWQGVEGGNQLTVSERPAGLTLTETAMYDPTAYLQVLGILPPEEARVAENNVRTETGQDPIPEGETSWAYRTIQGLLDDAAKADESGDLAFQSVADELGVGGNAAFWSVVVRGGAQVVEGFNNLAMGLNLNNKTANAKRDAKRAFEAVLLGGGDETAAQEAYDSTYAASMADIDFSMKNDLSKQLDAIQAMAMGYMSPEHQETFASMQENISNAEGFGGKAKAIWGEFKDHPSTFLTEFIAVEGVGEVVPLLAGGVAGFATKVAIKSSGKEITEQAAQLAMSTAARNTALGTDMLEAAGGGFTETYDDAYKVAEKYGKDVLGLDGAELEAYAGEYAGTLAFKVGLGSALMVGILVDGSQALESTIFKGALGEAVEEVSERSGSFISEVVDGAKRSGVVIALETGTEGIEAAVATTIKETALVDLDPSRDIAGELAENVILSSVAAAGTTSTILGFNGVVNSMGAGAAYTANVESDNPLVHLALTQNPDLQEAVNSKNIDAVKNTLLALGISTLPMSSDILNATEDSAYVSSTEAIQAYANIGINDPTKDDIELAMNLSEAEGFSDVDLDQQLKDAYELANPDDVTDTYAGRDTPQHHFDIIQKIYQMADEGKGVSAAFNFNEDNAITRADADAYRGTLNVFEREALAEYEQQVFDGEVVHTPNQTGILDDLVGDSIMTPTEYKQILDDISNLKEAGKSQVQINDALNQKYDGLFGADGVIATAVSNAFTDEDNIANFADSVITSLKEDGTLTDLSDTEAMQTVMENFVESDTFTSALPTIPEPPDVDGAIATAFGEPVRPAEGEDGQPILDEDGKPFMLAATGLYKIFEEMGFTDETFVNDAIAGLGDPDERTGIYNEIDSVPIYTDDDARAVVNAAIGSETNITTEIVDGEEVEVDAGPSGIYKYVADQVAAGVDTIDLTGYVQSIDDLDLTAYSTSAQVDDKITAAMGEQGGDLLFEEDGETPIIDPVTEEQAVSQPTGVYKILADLGITDTEQVQSIVDATIAGLGDPVERTGIYATIDSKTSYTDTDAQEIVDATIGSQVNLTTEIIDGEEVEVDAGPSGIYKFIADETAKNINPTELADSLKDYVKSDTFDNTLADYAKATDLTTAQAGVDALKLALGDPGGDPLFEEDGETPIIDETTGEQLLSGPTGIYKMFADAGISTADSIKAIYNLLGNETIYYTDEETGAFTDADGNILEEGADPVVELGASGVFGLLESGDATDAAIQAELTELSNSFSERSAAQDLIIGDKGGELLFGEDGVTPIVDETTGEQLVSQPSGIYGDIAAAYAQTGEDRKTALDNLFTDYANLPGFEDAVKGVMNDITTSWTTTFGSPAEYGVDEETQEVVKTKDASGVYLDFEKILTLPEGEQGQALVELDEKIADSISDLEGKVLGIDGETEGAIADAITNAFGVAPPTEGRDLYFRGQYLLNAGMSEEMFTYLTGLEGDDAKNYAAYKEWYEGTTDGFIKNMEELRYVTGLDTFKTNESLSDITSRLDSLENVDYESLGLSEANFKKIAAEALGDEGGELLFADDGVTPIVDDETGEQLVSQPTGIYKIAADLGIVGEDLKTFKDSITAVIGSETNITTQLNEETNEEEEVDAGPSGLFKLIADIPIYSDDDARDIVNEFAGDLGGEPVLDELGDPVLDKDDNPVLTQPTGLYKFIISEADKYIDSAELATELSTSLTDYAKTADVTSNISTAVLNAIGSQGGDPLFEEDGETPIIDETTGEQLVSGPTGIYKIFADMGFVDSEFVDAAIAAFGDPVERTGIYADIDAKTSYTDTDAQEIVDATLGSQVNLTTELIDGEEVEVDAGPSGIYKVIQAAADTAVTDAGTNAGQAIKDALADYSTTLEVTKKIQDAFGEQGGVPLFEEDGETPIIDPETEEQAVSDSTGLYKIFEEMGFTSAAQVKTAVDNAIAGLGDPVARTGIYNEIDAIPVYTDSDAQEIVDATIGSQVNLTTEIIDGEEVEVDAGPSGIYKFIADEVAKGIDPQELSTKLTDYVTSDTLETTLTDYAKTTAVDDKITAAIGSQGGDPLFEDDGITPIIDPETEEQAVSDPTGIYKILADLGITDTEQVQSIVDTTIAGLGDPVERTGIYNEIDSIPVYTDTDAQKIVDATLGSQVNLTTELIDGEEVEVDAGPSGIYKVIQDAAATAVTDAGTNAGQAIKDALVDYVKSDTLETTLTDYAKTTAVDDKITAAIGSRGGDPLFEEDGETPIIDPVTEEQAVSDPTGVYKILADLGITDTEQVQSIVDTTIAGLGDPVERTGIYADIDAKTSYSDDDAQAIVDATLGSQVNLTTELIDGEEVEVDAGPSGIYKVIQDAAATAVTDAGTNAGQAIQDALEDYVTSTDLDTTLEDYVTSTDLDTTLEDYAKTTAVDDKITAAIGSQFGDPLFEEDGETPIIDEVTGEQALSGPTGIYKILADLGITDTDAVNAIVGDITERTGVYGAIDDAIKTFGDSDTLESIITGVIGSQATDEEDATGVYAAIAAAEDRSATALQNAINTYVGSRSSVEVDDETGEETVIPATGVYEDIETVEGRLETVEGDVDTLEEDLGTAESDIETLEGRADTQDERLNELAALFGIDPNLITEDDIGALATIIADTSITLDEQVLLDQPELSGYDVTGDSVLDAQDTAAMQQAMDTGDYSNLLAGAFTLGSGLLKQRADDQAAYEYSLQQEQTANQLAQTEMQSQIDQMLMAQEQEEQEERMRRLFARGRSRTTAKPQDPAMIQYQYDMYGDSIFATPQQEKFFSTPYRKSKGGQIKAKTNEILRIIGDK